MACALHVLSVKHLIHLFQDVCRCAFKTKDWSVVDASALMDSIEFKVSARNAPKTKHTTVLCCNVFQSVHPMSFCWSLSVFACQDLIELTEFAVSVQRVRCMIQLPWDAHQYVWQIKFSSAANVSVPRVSLESVVYVLNAQRIKHSIPN